MTGTQLAELLDKQAISEMLTTYARAADRVDLPLLGSVFPPDAEMDYGAIYQGPAAGFVDFIGQVHPVMAGHAHLLGNILIRVDRDRAGSECYVRTWIRFPGAGEGRYRDLHSTGWYLDEWERRDGSWRIVRRRYLHEMEESRTVTEGTVGTDGARDRTDPSYALLAD